MTDDPLDEFFRVLGQPNVVARDSEGGVLRVQWTDPDALQKVRDLGQTRGMAAMESNQHPEKEVRLTWNRPEEPVCIGCGHIPDEIGEYVTMGKIEEMSPTDFVLESEGTYNPANGHFACDDCYMGMGAPSSPSGWRAP